MMALCFLWGRKWIVYPVEQ